MTTPDLMSIERWADRLEDLDREIARLALLCAVPILDPGAVERVLRNDASVCGVDNPVAFRRLHGLLNLYFVSDRHSENSSGNFRRPRSSATS